MAHFQLELRPETKIRRKDFITMAETMLKAAKDKKVDAFILTVNNPKVGAVQIPFPIVEK